MKNLEIDFINFKNYNLTEFEYFQIENWTKLKINEKIFDSNNDIWNKNTTTFTSKIRNKKNLVFLVEIYKKRNLEFLFQLKLKILKK